MDQAPAIALVEEGGELDDIRVLLDDLGMEFTSWDKHSAPAVGREPRHLLVASAGSAVSLRYQRQRSETDSAVWVAVTQTNSKTQRSLLLQAGFDYLVRRPVHPAALRLLIQRALFRGDSQRRGERYAVGYAVTYRSGLWPRKATLVDLSLGGCRLLTTHSLDKGEQILVQFPGEIDGGTPFSLTAAVVRTRRAEVEGGAPNESSLALRFIKANRRARSRLHALLRAVQSGPPALPARTAGDPFSATRAPRGSYSEAVYVFGSAQCALVGRDLSVGGMRVEQHPALTVGDQVKLALSAGSREEPIVVEARVARDDAELGLALQFSKVDEMERLEHMVETLPAIEVLSPGATQGARIVVSKIVPTLQRVAKKSRSLPDILRRK